MINCNSNNKGDTDQTYFKMIVKASCAILSTEYLHLRTQEIPI